MVQEQLPAKLEEVRIQLVIRKKQEEEWKNRKERMIRKTLCKQQIHHHLETLEAISCPEQLKKLSKDDLKDQIQLHQLCNSMHVTGKAPEGFLLSGSNHKLLEHLLELLYHLPSNPKVKQHQVTEKNGLSVAKPVIEKNL